jgi:glycosyltransferase involved in cell wall biosynthesis
MVLFLHNRYRTTGGEERVVEDLLWLVREHVGEQARLLTRDSADLSRARAAAGLLRGGIDPDEVGRAVSSSGARVVHAHNLHPAFGWRALAAARAAGARVVLHLHQYRLVCAVGVCFTKGEECTRCHGRDTLPGARLNCRGSRPEAAAYAASLALWQRRLVEQADAVIVPSAFARERLRALGAPLDWERVHVLPPPVRAPAASWIGSSSTAVVRSSAVEAIGARDDPAGRSTGAIGAAGFAAGSYALVASRLAPEKGVDVAIDACGIAGVPLVVAGDGPEAGALRARAGDDAVRFLGRVDEETLTELRTGALVALVPSRSAETFGMAAAQAMAAGVPVVGSEVGALGELIERDALAPAGDAQALADAIARIADDRESGERGRQRVNALCAPDVVARALGAIYDGQAGG